MVPTSVHGDSFLDGKAAAAAITGIEERRRAELDCYRYIRIHQWPAGSFNISGFQRLVPRSQRHIARNILATMDAIYVESDTL